MFEWRKDSQVEPAWYPLPRGWQSLDLSNKSKRRTIDKAEQHGSPKIDVSNNRAFP